MKLHIAILFIAAFGISCAATTVYPGAQKVRITNNEPTNCEFLGDVTANQGNFFTGGITSNSNLETGARNDLKNKAFKIGGNTVYLLTNRAGQTGNTGGSSQQTNVTLSGNVYKCAPISISETTSPTPEVKEAPVVETPVEKAPVVEAPVEDAPK